MQKYSRVCAVISLDAVEENFKNMRANTNPEARMIAVVKTDGYGHGAVPVAKLVEEKFGITHVMMNTIGATIGAHAGPGTVALFFLGDYR